MHVFIALLFFLAQPFWETKPPEKWNDQEIDTVLHRSPWVQDMAPDPSIQVYLATAAPIEQAWGEVRIRSTKPLPLPDPDYLDYLRDNREQAFVLAIPYAKPGGVGGSQELKRMEQETEMKIGKKSYRILGHFPPTVTDPVLRLVFPREVKPTDKTVVFKSYVPGVPFPERDASFFVKDLMYHDKLEM